MKKLILLLSLIVCTTANAYTNNFRPYIGINAGLNIVDYAIETDLDENYYSAIVNAGARIGGNFGFEFFFTHSSNNNLERVSEYLTQNHEVYYMGYGFDIYGYYNMTPQFDFFTTFGVANYKFYDERDYISGLESTSDKISDGRVTTRIGIGFLYTFPGDNVSALFRYQYIPVNLENLTNMNEFSFGMRYTF